MHTLRAFEISLGMQIRFLTQQARSPTIRALCLPSSTLMLLPVRFCPVPNVTASFRTNLAIYLLKVILLFPTVLIDKHLQVPSVTRRYGSGAPSMVM